MLEFRTFIQKGDRSHNITKPGPAIWNWKIAYSTQFLMRNFMVVVLSPNSHPFDLWRSSNVIKRESLSPGKWYIIWKIILCWFQIPCQTINQSHQLTYGGQRRSQPLTSQVAFNKQVHLSRLNRSFHNSPVSPMKGNRPQGKELMSKSKARQKLNIGRYIPTWVINCLC